MRRAANRHTLVLYRSYSEVQRSRVDSATGFSSVVAWVTGNALRSAAVEEGFAQLDEMCRRILEKPLESSCAGPRTEPAWRATGPQGQRDKRSQHGHTSAEGTEPVAEAESISANGPFCADIRRATDLRMAGSRPVFPQLSQTRRFPVNVQGKLTQIPCRGTYHPLFLLVTVITAIPESTAFPVELNRFVQFVVYV